MPIPVEPPVAFSSRFSEAPEKVAQWKAFLKQARVRAEVPPLPEIVGSSRDQVGPLSAT